jgi:hypothetical protein
MSTTIQLPDGSTVTVDTDDIAAATEAGRKYWKSLGGDLPAPPPRTGLQTLGDYVGDVVDNITPNWGDELAALPDAAGALWDGKDVGAAFREGREAFKAHQAQYDQEHPNLSWVSTLAGAGLGLALPGGALARGASMGAKALQAAKIGAAYGALSGAGEGESLEDRAANAMRSGAIGATFGAVATPLIEAVPLAHRWATRHLPGYEPASRGLRNVPLRVIRNPLRTRDDRAREQADRLLAQRMSEGNITTSMGQTGPAASPEALAAEMERRRAMGVPALPGDLTDSLRGTASWASRGMGPGQRLVRERLDARKAQEAARARQHVVDTFGPVGDPLRQLEDMARDSKARAAPGYRRAYAEPMVITPQIEAIMQTPAFRDAVPQAVTNIRNGMQDPMALGFRLREDGTMDPMLHRNLSTEGFDQVIRAMRDNGRAAMDSSGFRPADTTNSLHINGRARDLRQALADQNPDYREVVEQYADDMSQRDAFQSGQDVGRLTGHEVNAQARHMPQNAQGSWSIGARTALADAASDHGAKYPTGDTAAHLRKLLGDEVKQEAIGQMTGNTGAVRGLQDRLEAEHQGNILWKEVQGNSKTASRLQNDADMAEAAGSSRPGIPSKREMANAALGFLANRADRGFESGMKDRVARVLTEEDPQALRDFMSTIAAGADRDAAKAQGRHRNTVGATKAYASHVEPVRPDEAPAYYASPENTGTDVTAGADPTWKSTDQGISQAQRDFAAADEAWSSALAAPDPDGAAIRSLYETRQALARRLDAEKAPR